VLRLTARSQAIAAAALAVAALSGGVAVLVAHGHATGQVANAGGSARFTRARVITTSEGEAIVRQVDRERELVYEISTSAEQPSNGLLVVRLVHGASPRARAGVTGRVFEAVCHVPGGAVGTFGPQLWDVYRGDFATPISVANNRVALARAATDCRLHPVDVFGHVSRKAFSTVRLR
jgi:hypothetical protein